MSSFFLITQHSKVITPPFATPFLDATTHDGKKIRFYGVEHYTHGRNLTIMKYQGTPLLLWVSDYTESEIDGVDYEVPAGSVIAVLPHNTKPLKQAVQSGEGDAVMKPLKKEYPMLKTR